MLVHPGFMVLNLCWGLKRTGQFTQGQFNQTTSDDVEVQQSVHTAKLQVTDHLELSLKHVFRRHSPQVEAGDLGW